MAFVTHTTHGLEWLSSTVLHDVPHGFSTRLGGVSRPPWDSLNLGSGRGDDLNAVRENYRRFCAAIGGTDTSAGTDCPDPADFPGPVDYRRVVLAKQVHETTVRTVLPADAGKGLWTERDYTADALVTDVPGLPLVIFSADCGNILLWDMRSGAVGAVHAGWRGCAAGIVEKAVHRMKDAFHTDAARLRAAIGPCIGPCCFETDSDVPDAMRQALGTDAEPFLVQRGVKYHVDLAGLNRLWLLRAGLRPEHIDVSGVCTACHPDRFWSHRKMGDRRGVQAALIMRREA